MFLRPGHQIGEAASVHLSGVLAERSAIMIDGVPPPRDNDVRVEGALHMRIGVLGRANRLIKSAKLVVAAGPRDQAGHEAVALSRAARKRRGQSDQPAGRRRRHDPLRPPELRVRQPSKGGLSLVDVGVDTAGARQHRRRRHRRVSGPDHRRCRLTRSPLWRRTLSCDTNEVETSDNRAFC